MTNTSRSGPRNTSHENKADEYLCPYDSCRYSAPTERQVRSHITLADHGEHNGVDGYSIEVDVLGSQGETHSYKNKNKVSLPETTLPDITNDEPLGKQIILKIAYNNSDKNYVEIHEIADSEGVEYSYSVVRDTVRTHIEAVPTNEDHPTDNAQISDDVTDEMEPHSYQFDPTDQNPFTASPDFYGGSNKRSSNPQESSNSGATTGVNSDTRNTGSQSATSPMDQEESDQSTPSSDNFPYDTNAVPDYWSETGQKIIATQKALDNPTPVEVHSELTDTLGYDIDISVVQNLLDGWRKNEYDELTETQQRAIDAMADQAEDETLADVAERYDIPEGTIKYVRYTHTHILADEGGPVPGLN